jgi:hypothetical protein
VANNQGLTLGLCEAALKEFNCFRLLLFKINDLAFELFDPARKMLLRFISDLLQDSSKQALELFLLLLELITKLLELILIVLALSASQWLGPKVFKTNHWVWSPRRWPV